MYGTVTAFHSIEKSRVILYLVYATREPPKMAQFDWDIGKYPMIEISNWEYCFHGKMSRFASVSEEKLVWSRSLFTITLFPTIHRAFSELLLKMFTFGFYEFAYIHLYYMCLF